MIEEDYVSRETYKLLKEKGYDGEFKTCYDTEGYTCPAIHIYDAMKWLRKKGMIITIVYERCSMHTIGPQMMFGFNIQNTQGELLAENTDVAYDSYKQAGMAAIKHSLENLA